MRTMRISFTVYGEPVAQGRPRMKHIKTKDGREFDKAYDPTKSRNWKQEVSRVAQDYVPDRLLTGALVLTVRVFRPIPKSFSMKKQVHAMKGILRPTTRPDLSNYIKGVEDALVKKLFRDDSQIISYGASGKWYGDPPRVEVILEEPVDIEQLG